MGGNGRKMGVPGAGVLRMPLWYTQSMHIQPHTSRGNRCQLVGVTGWEQALSSTKCTCMLQQWSNLSVTVGMHETALCNSVFSALCEQMLRDTVHFANINANPVSTATRRQVNCSLIVAFTANGVLCLACAMTCFLHNIKAECSKMIA